jgi:hypothetical protein
MCNFKTKKKQMILTIPKRALATATSLRGRVTARDVKGEEGYASRGRGMRASSSLSHETRAGQREKHIH